MKLSRISGIFLALLVYGPLAAAAVFSVHSVYAREAGKAAHECAVMAKAGCGMDNSGCCGS